MKERGTTRNRTYSCMFITGSRPPGTKSGRPKTTLQAARWSQKPVCLDCRDVILLQI